VIADVVAVVAVAAGVEVEVGVVVAE